MGWGRDTQREREKSETQPKRFYLHLLWLWLRLRLAACESNYISCIVRERIEISPIYFAADRQNGLSILFFPHMHEQMQRQKETQKTDSMANQFHSISQSSMAAVIKIRQQQQNSKSSTKWNGINDQLIKHGRWAGTYFLFFHAVLLWLPLSVDLNIFHFSHNLPSVTHVTWLLLGGFSIINILNETY